MVKLPNFCPECGNELISPKAELCPECGVRLKPDSEKSPGIAALCSFLFTGLGQVYNGNFGRGVLILLGTAVGYLFFIIPGLAVYVYGIYDAYRTATRMNAGEVPYQETNVLHMVLFVVFWFIAIAAFLVLLAVLMAALNFAAY